MLQDQGEDLSPLSVPTLGAQMTIFEGLPCIFDLMRPGFGPMLESTCSIARVKREQGLSGALKVSVRLYQLQRLDEGFMPASNLQSRIGSNRR